MAPSTQTTIAAVVAGTAVAGAIAYGYVPAPLETWTQAVLLISGHK